MRDKEISLYFVSDASALALQALSEMPHGYYEVTMKVRVDEVGACIGNVRVDPQENL